MTRYPAFGAANPFAANPLGISQPFGAVVGGQVDIIFAITKSGFRCMMPFCNKPLCPWTTCPRDNCPFFSRLDHRYNNAGMRGLGGTNNIICGFGCAVCARQGSI